MVIVPRFLVSKEIALQYSFDTKSLRETLRSYARGTKEIFLKEEYMEQLSAKKLKQALEEMKDISRMEFLLFSRKGKLSAGTIDEIDNSLCESVAQFAKSPAESQVVREWIFFRVEVDGQTEYVLLCSKGVGADASYMLGRMAVCQIRNLCISTREPMDQMNFLRQIFCGEIPRERIEEKNHQLRLKSGKFVLYAIQFTREKDSVVLETLKNLFVVRYVDYLVEMDGTKVVLMKNVTGIEDGNYEQYARVIVDNLQAEAMTNVWIGYGDAVDSFEQMSEAYGNACISLKIGKIFYSEERVFYYNRLGIGRLIYQLPLDLCEIFLKEILGENANVDFDEETLTTINQLFDNNLNISETARQLYIHRNTLVYRLERIEKKLGLDIRSFEDAMLFKIAMMVRTHVKTIRQ